MFILNHHKSLANHFLAELRDVNQQGDRLRFRKNLERLGEVLAYEISKELNYTSSSVQSPLQTSSAELLVSQPVIIPILRAGIPFFQGFLNFYDRADCGFIGAYRKESGGHKAEVEVDFGYMAAPDINGKEVIMVDPMLATGKSFVESYKQVLEKGMPTRIHVAAVIAAPEGIEYIKQHITVKHKIWICALDEKLNNKFYIVPGLGDAGDLAYGTKQ